MQRSVSAVAVLLSLGLAGCGPELPEIGDVTGKVTIDGKPAPGVVVTFLPKGGGRSSTAMTDAEGNYELQYSPDSMGALVGSHEATIAQGAPSADAVAPTTRGPLVDKSIPKAYLAVKKPVEVKAGDNTIDLTYP